MPEKNIQKNYIYNTLYQIFKIITPLITTPYISRILGADGIGTYSYISAIVSNFILFAGLGIGTYGQREISYLQDNVEDRSLRFWEIECLNLFSVGLTIVLYILYIFTVKKNIEIYCICILQILTIAADVGWIFSGMEDFPKIAIRDFIFKFFNIIGIFLFVNSKNDLKLYALLLSALPLFSAISLWFYLPEYIIRIPVKKLRPFRHLKETVALFIPTIAINVYSVWDKIMLGIILNNAYENGYYEQAYKIIRISLTIVTSLGTVIVPRIGHYYSKGDFDAIKNTVSKSFNFVWFLSCPICFGLIGCSANFVPWFLGPDYVMAIPLIKILAFLIIIIGLNNITGFQILVPTKRQKYFTITVCLGAITNIILNAIFIPSLGSKGAAVSSVIAEIIVLLTEIWIIRKEFHFRQLFTISGNYVFASFFMMVLLLFEDYYLQPGIFQTVIMIISGLSLYTSILMILKDDFLKDYGFICLNKLIFYIKRHV